MNEPAIQGEPPGAASGAAGVGGAGVSGATGIRPGSAADAEAGNGAATGTAGTTLYSPGQIYVASLIGTPLAAAWFLALNSRALGDRKQAGNQLLRGTFATAAVSGVASFLPIQAWSLLWPIVYSFAIAAYARKVFGGRYPAAGTRGDRGSWWLVIATSAAVLLVLMGVMYAMALVLR